MCSIVLYLNFEFFLPNIYNAQGPGRHPFGGVPYLDLDTVLNEQGLGRRIFSDSTNAKGKEASRV
jgi:hypothetical protein